MALVGAIRIRVQTRPRIRCRVLPRLMPINATVAVGTVTTLPPGSQATVVDSGADGALVLNFGLPQGATGSPGDMSASVYDPAGHHADAFARGNHTGTQLAATISDFSTAADLRIAAAVGVSVQAYDADLASWAGVTRAAGFDTFAGSPTSANLRTLLGDEVGTGTAYFVGGALGAPASAVLTNGTGLPIAGLSGLATNMAAFLAGGTSAQLAAAVTDETGMGPLVFGSTPVTKTADFAVAATENSLICNKGSSLTVTLPAASSFSGRRIRIKTITAFTVVSASSNVAPLTSATLGTAILAATAGKWADLESDGTNWAIMAGN